MRVEFCHSSIFLVMVAVLHHLAHGEEHCEEDRPALFNRMFHVYIKGSELPTPTESTLRWALGDCGKLEDFAQEAISYFEKYTDLSVVKQNPYVAHDHDDYYIILRNMDNTSNYRILAESHEKFANYRGTRLIWISMELFAKKDLVGLGGTLRANHVDGYVMYRFMTEGQEFCVKTWARVPGSINSTSGTVDLSASSQEWGPGAARGHWILEKGVFELHYIFTFPADPLYF